MVTFLGNTFRFTKALSYKPFALLWSGQAISRLGDGAYTTAIAWQILLLTGSATAMGVVLVASSIPMIAFLLGGVFDLVLIGLALCVREIRQME